jgi:hypothetical protein
MNIESSREFINSHKDQVIDLFLTYQLIEMVLFFKLHLPNKSDNDEDDDLLENTNKKINSKTFGKLKSKYLEKFPNDDYHLSSDLDLVATQRNGFMHSLWMIIAIADGRDEIRQVGEVLLNDFIKQSHLLLDKIYTLPG